MRKPTFLLTAGLILLLIAGCGQKTIEIQSDSDGYGKGELPNGITLLVNYDPSTSLSAGRILIGGGVLSETEMNNGITNLMIRMLLKGNSTMSASEISEELDFLGANVTVDCYKDYSAISFVSLTSNFDQVVDIISRCLINPSFPKEELDKLKIEVEGNLKSEEDNQSTASSKLYWRTAFGDKSYGLPSSGTMGTVTRISLEDVREHYNNYVGGKNVIIAVASDMELDRLTDLVQKSFRHLKPEAKVLPAPSLDLQADTLGFKSFDRNQSFIYTGVILDKPSLTDACYISLLDEVMGKNVGSRLWFLRQKEKLAYAVYTQDIFYKYCASFRAAIGTDTSKVKKALASLDREWSKMVSDGITDTEFDDARVNLKNNLIYQIDKKSNRANHMAEYEYLGYGQKFVLDMLATIDQATLDGMNSYVEGFAKKKRYTSIVGKK